MDLDLVRTNQIFYWPIQMDSLMDIKLHNLLHIVKLFQKAMEAWKEIMNIQVKGFIVIF